MNDSVDEIMKQNKKKSDEKLKFMSMLRKLVGYFTLAIALVIGIYSGYGLINDDLPKVNLILVLSILAVSFVFAALVIKNRDKSKALAIVAPIITVILVFVLFYILR